MDVVLFTGKHWIWVYGTPLTQNTRHYWDVDFTFFERYGRQMDFKITLCAYWAYEIKKKILDLLPSYQYSVKADPSELTHVYWLYDDLKDFLQQGCTMQNTTRIHQHLKKNNILNNTKYKVKSKQLFSSVVVRLKSNNIIMYLKRKEILSDFATNLSLHNFLL